MIVFSFCVVLIKISVEDPLYAFAVILRYVIISNGQYQSCFGPEQLK